MEKKHFITIAGKLGSGKSSTAKRVASTLGYEHYSSGDLMRILAKDRGMTLGELSTVAETDTSIDEELDLYVKKIGEKENVVIDSRLGFYWIPNSFKVFLELDPETASTRISEDTKTNTLRHHEHTGSVSTNEDLIESIEARLSSEKKRYFNLYNIKDHTDNSQFDLVIDTKINSLDEVVEKVLKEYKNWLTH